MAAAIAAAIGLSAPTQAAPNQKFEATITAPAHDANAELWAGACPGPGDADGLTYVFLDLKSEYKHLKTYGPAHLFNEPDPTGLYHDANDYDIDLYVFDSKCKPVGDSASPGGTEKVEARRPARYAVIAYWSGIHVDLPVTLEVSHTKIK